MKYRGKPQIDMWFSWCFACLRRMEDTCMRDNIMLVFVFMQGLQSETALYLLLALW